MVIKLACAKCGDSEVVIDLTDKDWWKRKGTADIEFSRCPGVAFVDYDQDKEEVRIFF